MAAISAMIVYLVIAQWSKSYLFFKESSSYLYWYYTLLRNV
jgi:hypothetical protein